MSCNDVFCGLEWRQHAGHHSNGTGTDVHELSVETILIKLLKLGPRVGTRFGYVEPPVIPFRSPWIFSWTEFEFPCLQVEPVDIFVNKMSRKVSKECGPRNEL